jgi:hypothetical protein
VYDLEGCATPLKPRLPKGFTVLAHEYYLFGSCMACQRA